MISTFYIIGSVLLVSAISLTGIFLVRLRPHALQRCMFILVSFAVGSLLGDVFIHILPEIVEKGEDFFPLASLLVAAGIVLSFILEKIIRWRHCHSTECREHPQAVGTMMLIGDAAHNITDGLLIAGSYLVDTQIGIATTLAVIFHEIPQEIGDYAILIFSGYSKTRALVLNMVTTLTAMAGAIVFLSLHTYIPNMEQYLLPLVAGNFLYIAVADLLPELHKQTRILHTCTQLVAVMAGITLMFAITLIE